MMFFSEFPSISTTTQTCSIHPNYSLDLICLNPDCTSSSKLCVLCSFESHRNHQTIPIKIFLSKCEELISNNKNEHLNIEIQQIEYELHRLQSKLIIFRQRIESKIKLIFEQMNELLEKQCRSLKETQYNDYFFWDNLMKAKQTHRSSFSNFQNLMDSITINFDEFYLKRPSINKEKLIKVKETVNNLERDFDISVKRKLVHFEEALEELPERFKNPFEERKEDIVKLWRGLGVEQLTINV